MIQFILDFISNIALRHAGDPMMAVLPVAAGLAIKALPTVISGISSIFGADKEAKARAAMARERAKWNSENEALFNKDYYSDYTQQADAQNVIRQMREESKRQGQIENNVAAVNGTTAEAQNAAKERRNKFMTNLYAGIAANGQAYKERAKTNYLNRKANLQEMNYQDMSDKAQSANNLLYNGIGGLAATDWAGILSGNKKPDQLPAGKIAESKVGDSSWG